MTIIPSIRRKYMTNRNPGGKIPLDNAVVILDKDVWMYTGNAITPTPTVTLRGENLTVNLDYVVNYTGNVNVGQGVVTITGIGGYEGSRQKSFVIEAAPYGWNFDITKTGNAVSSVELMDAGATYMPNEAITVNSMQILPDGSLHFGADAQGQAYIWKFEEGHEMELSHLGASFHARRTAVLYFQMGLFSEDGKHYYDATSSQFRVSSTTTDTPFDFYWCQPSQMVAYSGLSAIPYRAKFSKDGHHFYYASGYASGGIYHRYLPTAWDLASYDESVERETYKGDLDGNTRDFCVSPDNTKIVLICTLSTGSSAKVYSMQSPGDIESMELIGSVALKTVSGDILYYGQAVCVNDSGTKMLVWVNHVTVGVTYQKSIYEYNLER